MCGRYTIIKSPEELEKEFEIDINKEVFETTYNLAPSQNGLVITNQHKNEGQFFKWGLIPFWAKDEKIGYKMINARSETLTEKSAFKTPLQKRRCVVIADGFYEWKKIGKEKHPSYIYLANKKPFAMAGLWETWSSPAKETIHSFTIITTKANEFMSTLHDRMPVIFDNNSDINLWLDNELSANEHLQLLQQLPSDKMAMHQVSQMVNSPKNNQPLLITPLENLGTLF